MTKLHTTNRKRRSQIWTLPDSLFIDLVRKSKRMKDVLNFFGVACKGGNFNTAKERIRFLGLDTSHFVSRTESSAIGRRVSEKSFREIWLVENSLISRSAVKRNLLRFEMILDECSGCGNQGMWKDKPLTLQLEHKNGISNDHRLQNLCLLCPNCHSQTETYAGKNCRART